MLDEMDRSERLRLLRFVTSFAWADGVVQEEERQFLRGLIERLPLGKDEIELAEGWLDKPPHPAEVDPSRVPPKHRELFLTVVHGMINADSHVDPEEQERLDLLEQMLRRH